MIRRPPRSTLDRSSAASDVYKRQLHYLSVLELQEGHAQVALDQSRRFGEVWRQMGVAMAEHSLGHVRESQQALDELIAKYAHDWAFQIAEVYAWRGEPDKAFEWLERAYVQRDPGFAVFKSDPTLKSLWL